MKITGFQQIFGNCKNLYFVSPKQVTCDYGLQKEIPKPRKVALIPTAKILH